MAISQKNQITITSCVYMVFRDWGIFTLIKNREGSLQLRILYLQLKNII